MPQAKEKDTVKVHYTGKLEDGTVFDSSEGRDPLEFTVGGGQVIPGFDEAVVGLEVGESRTATLPPEDAYGPHREELVLSTDRGQFPEDAEPQVGDQFQLATQSGQRIPATVVEIEGDAITLDANHPLAGKALVFDIELVEIV